MQTVKHIHLKPVSSRQIDSIGYDAASRTLRVKFKGSGSTYDYANVPPEAHEAFAKAESLGKHLGAHIKGKYEFKKLPAPAKAA